MSDFNIDLPPEILENLNRNQKAFANNCQNLFDELNKRKIEDISEKSKSDIIDENKLKVSFFEKEVIFDRKEKELYFLGEVQSKKGKNLDTFSSFLVLHYLINADGTPPGGEWISYRELPGGLFYWQTIPGVLKPLVKKYGNNGEEFVAKTLEIGGSIYKGFKYSSVIYPFRMFPVLMILYEKSEEFEADLRVLFDKTAPHYLKVDVIKLVIIYIVKRLRS